MNEFRNEFSWSKSRDEIFQTCPRQYYFNYYAYWGGWEKDAPERTRQIYVLKKLKNRYMWAGEKVHGCIKHTLINLRRGISVLDVDDIISITINQMREEFRSSRERRYHVYPKTCALFEHEYELDLADDQWKAVVEEVEQCLRNFYRSEIFSMLKEITRERWLEVEDFSFFYLDETKMWSVLDCSFETEEGITIIDWKTGKGINEDLSLQLSCYAMYGVEKWRIRPEKIKLIEYNLLSDQSTKFSFTEGEIDSTKAYIKGSIADMQSLLVDIENNIPKEEQSFSKVGDERTRNSCNFRKVCD